MRAVAATVDLLSVGMNHNQLEAVMGGKPNPGTKRDKRLKTNRRKSKKGKK